MHTHIIQELLYQAAAYDELTPPLFMTCWTLPEQFSHVGAAHAQGFVELVNQDFVDEFSFILFSCAHCSTSDGRQIYAISSRWSYKMLRVIECI